MSDKDEKDVWTLVSDYKRNWLPESKEHEERKLRIMIQCVQDIVQATKSLEKSTNNNAKASDRLARKVFWLNVIIALATAAMLLLAFCRSC